MSSPVLGISGGAVTEEAEERTAITAGPVPDVVARGLPSVLARTGRSSAAG